MKLQFIQLWVVVMMIMGEEERSVLVNVPERST